MSQDLEVAAEFQVCDCVSLSELMNKFAETGHVKVSLLSEFLMPLLLYTLFNPLISQDLLQIRQLMALYKCVLIN